VCGLLLSASGHGSGDADDAPGAGVQSTAAQMPVPAAVSNAPIGGPAQNPTTALTTHSTPATHSAAKLAPAKQAKQPSPEKEPPSGHDNGKHKGHGKGKAHP